MMLNEFEVMSYGLSKWVGVNPELKAELQGNGWRKGKKMLTPLQVRTIVQYLGEP